MDIFRTFEVVFTNFNAEGKKKSRARKKAIKQEIQKLAKQESYTATLSEICVVRCLPSKEFRKLLSNTLTKQVDVKTQRKPYLNKIAVYNLTSKMKLYRKIPKSLRR